MTWMITALRRTLWLVLIGAVGGVAWSWWRDRNDPPAPAALPEWPPLAPTESTTEASSDATPTEPAARSSRNEPTAAAPKSDPPSGQPSATASIVNALVDAPDARSTAASGTWVSPNEDGSCPDSHPVKANDNSGIFHVPGGRFYNRTKAERCYATAEAALADGYRAAKA